MHDVGHFEIKAYLGTSGISDVYLARDPQLDRKVVVKRPRSDGHFDRDDVIREEGRMLASFAHPHVLAVHGLGEHEGRPYLVLEFCEGGSLRDVMRFEVLTIESICRLMAQVADAVHHVHRRGYLHRSISPLSIFLDGEGRARLGGFVVATSADDVATQRFRVPAFLAPEQRSSRTEATPATDVWGIGISMFCALLARPLDDIVGAHLSSSAPLPPFATLAPTVPVAVAQVVDRCLQADPQARFASVADLREALLAAVESRNSGRRQVFVSYSTLDQTFVENDLAPFLQRHEVDVWFAQSDVPSASQWERAILSAMQQSDWFVLVMSRHSARSEWVKDEVAWAVEHRRQRIVPIKIDDCDPLDFHLALNRIQWLDFLSDATGGRRVLLDLLAAGA